MPHVSAALALRYWLEYQPYYIVSSARCQCIAAMFLVSVTVCTFAQ